MAECRCDTCLNSRAIISENGYHSVCCLSQKKAVDCITKQKDYYAGNPSTRTPKERGGGEVITEKQKALIDDMNEFCAEKFKYDESTTKEEARKYISRNIEQFKLLTMDNWQMQYL